jgi:transcriptional regulator with XRE-family HTH domain
MAGRPRERRGPRPPIAHKLRAARAARGLSQHAAAAELEIPPAVLAEYESGSRQPSGLAKKYLEAWAAACLGEPYSLIPTDKKQPKP